MGISLSTIELETGATSTIGKLSNSMNARVGEPFDVSRSSRGPVGDAQSAIWTQREHMAVALTHVYAKVQYVIHMTGSKAV